MLDLNRVGFETEFTYLNEVAVAFADYGMKFYFHFRFSVWFFYCRWSDFFLGVFSGVSEFNLARIALLLTMPTILARTVPLKK